MTAAVSRHACELFNEAHQFFPFDLAGACGLASHFLFCNLKNDGYRPVFIMASSDEPSYGNHCWVKVGDFHVDITATQYGLSPIYSFNGRPEAHQGLRDYYGFRIKNWTFNSAVTERGIDRLMLSWTELECYRGLQRRRLDNFYRN